MEISPIPPPYISYNKRELLNKEEKMTQNLTQGERIHSIDIIRGIAVLGIFLVNYLLSPGLTHVIFQEFTKG